MELYTDQRFCSPCDLLKSWEQGGSFKLLKDFGLDGGTVLKAGTRVNCGFFDYFPQNHFVLQSDRFQVSITVKEGE